jgi:cytochrome bd-type quinol oxidase subunit 2
MSSTSSSTTGATLPTLPVTSARLTPSGWLRVALVAALGGVVLALPFQLMLGEAVLDRAVAAEHASAHGAGVAELFSRTEQRGGLVTGQLLIGLGVAFALAGAAFLLAGSRGAPRAVWVRVSGGAVWAVAIVPAILMPPLPPGVDSDLALGTRQALYLAAIALGVVTYACATAVLAARRRGWREVAAASLLLALGLIAAAALFPDQGGSDALAAAELEEFRLVSLVGQLLFWGGIAIAGFLVLRPVRMRRAV